MSLWTRDIWSWVETLIWSAEDVSLGPPRTLFPSSRNVKLSELAGDKGTGDAAGEEQDSSRRAIFGERGNRKNATEKDGSHMKGSWTTARDKRQQAGEDGVRQEGRHNRRNGDQDGEPRNTESRWGRDEQRQGDRTSWRDREQKKNQGWGNRETPAEKEPEWMDDPAPPAGDDDLRTMGMRMPKTQEDFQRWKDEMNGKKAPVEDFPEEHVPVKEALSAKPATTLKLEGINDKPFGGWGEVKSSPAGTLDGTTGTVKSAQGPTKVSRFANVFNQSQIREDPAPEMQAAPMRPNGSAEDAAGFQRLMGMLKDTTVSPAIQPEGPSSPPPARITSNGTKSQKSKSRFTDFFEGTPKSPERMQSPPEAGIRTNGSDVLRSRRSMVGESPQMFGARLPESYRGQQPLGVPMGRNPLSPEPMPPTLHNRDSQHQLPHQRSNDISNEQPPSRGTATPDLNIQNLLASRPAQRPEGQDKNSAFLLNLLTTKGGSRQQAQPNNGFGALWLDQPPNATEPYAPKPRAPPPPGLFEDQLLRNNGPDTVKHELPQQMPGMDMPQRRTSQRAPPGFYDEQGLFLQQQQQQAQAQAAQRRTFGEPPQQHQMQPGRRMSGHPNLPPLPMQNFQQYPPGPPQPPLDFIQSPGGGPPPVPPPGFNPQIPRHPPGIHNAQNIFQGPPMQPQQPQGREPPGFPSMPGSMPPGGMQSPPNAPPGFYGGPQGLPPNYMQMRSPGEPMPPNGGLNMRGGRGPFEGGFDLNGMNGPRR